MDKDKKQKVANALAERSRWLKVGWMHIRIRPLTLSQIYDMGAAASDINSDDLQKLENVNIIALLTKHAKDAKAMQDVFIVCAYRKKWKRLLFGKWLRGRLTIEHFNKLLAIIASTFNANFFLTSIIFLSQTKIMTEPSQTTPLGQSSEE